MDNLLDKPNRNYVQIIGFTLIPDEEKYTQQYIDNLLEKSCKYNSDYIIFPEYRNNLLQTGLHYHGIIKIYDKYKLFKKGKRILDTGTNMLPRYEIDITSAWYEYIQKDQCLPQLNDSESTGSEERVSEDMNDNDANPRSP